jgi:hypothetical protein
MSKPFQISRREAIQWVVSASAGVALLHQEALGADGASSGLARPYGTDPILNKTYKPGDFWPLTLDGAQRTTVTALCDLIVPEDDRSPAASKVGVPAFIDEWISAPYPLQQADRVTVLAGLVWLSAESKKRFGKEFAELTTQQQAQIADDICYLPKAKPEFREAAAFFTVFRNLTTTGFYTTPAGMKDIGYRGNTPLMRFEGPPAEIRAKVGLA